MITASNAGFEEVEHIADWELHAWAPDLVALLEQTARGMYTLAGARLLAEPRLQKNLSLQAVDPESLVVGFLSELLYLSEQENLAFDHFDLILEGTSLQARLEGAPLAAITKEIKAVTYHRLEVRTTGRGLEVNIIFDV